MRIGSVGWKHRHWHGSFYPESLPDEWRLTYYSNAFACVLLPGADMDAADVGQWLDDTHEQFRFYPAFDCADQAALQSVLGLASTLGARLGGLVCARAGELTAGTKRLAQQLSEMDVPIAIEADAGADAWIAAGIAAPVWRPGATDCASAVGLVSHLPAGDRRALKVTIEDFARQAHAYENPALFFEGAGLPAQTLLDAVVIAELLGE